MTSAKVETAFYRNDILSCIKEHGHITSEEIAKELNLPQHKVARLVRILRRVDPHITARPGSGGGYVYVPDGSATDTGLKDSSLSIIDEMISYIKEHRRVSCVGMARDLNISQSDAVSYMEYILFKYPEFTQDFSYHGKSGSLIYSGDGEVTNRLSLHHKIVEFMKYNQIYNINDISEAMGIHRNSARKHMHLLCDTRQVTRTRSGCYIKGYHPMFKNLRNIHARILWYMGEHGNGEYTLSELKTATDMKQNYLLIRHMAELCEQCPYVTLIKGKDDVWDYDGILDTVWY